MTKTPLDCDCSANANRFFIVKINGDEVIADQEITLAWRESDTDADRMERAKRLVKPEYHDAIEIIVPEGME